ncbi:DUF4157 domain-containing protein [Hoeflea sp.]|uniref:eCIS core domain-containing protein n=1 Tax=Hoeflea sp. TaxID=1940281 RepID=UPI003B01AEFD
MKRSADRKPKAPRIRPGPSRHEAQAVASVRAIDKGQPIPRLDPAPAAPRLSPPGSGRPLPLSLRDDAERSFDADLSAVRVHTDADGSHAPQGIAALSAGADIHVASVNGLNGEAGRDLLFHEITHVLQQTGERGPDGRLRATRRFGSGVPLALGGPLYGWGAPDRDDLIRKLVDMHRTGDGGAEDLDLEAVVTRISGEFDPERAGGSALSAEIRAGEVSGTGKPLHELSRRARGLLFDVLKFGGFNTAAATLLTGDIDIPSVALHHPFLTDAMSRSAVVDVVKRRVFARGRRLRQFITRAYPQAVWNYLIDLSRGRQPIYGFISYRDELLEEANDWNVLGRNEAIVYGAGLIDSFVTAYEQMIDQIQEQTSYLRDNPVLQRAEIAARIGRWSTAMAASIEESGGQAFRIEAHRHTAMLAQRAIDYWTSASTRGKETFEAAISDAEEGRAFPEFPIVALVRSRIEDAGLRLLETTPENNLPAPRVDRANRRNFRRAMERLIATLDTHIRRQVSREEGEFEEAHVIAGALRLLVPRLIENLDYFQSFTTSSDAPSQIGDVRVASRIRMARVLSTFAKMLRSRSLERRSADVLAGRDIEESSLALLSDWEEDPSTPVSAMAGEIGKLTVEDEAHLPISFTVGEGEDRRSIYLPLTVSDLAGIYELMRSRRLANALSRMLAAPEPEAGDEDQGNIIQRAQAEARGDDRPMRWQVATFEYVEYEKNKSSFRELVKSHRRTREELAPQVQKMGAVVFPDHPSAGVFAWLIPSLDPLIRILRPVRLLNQMIEQESGSPASELSNAEWIATLSVATKDPDNLNTILGAVPVTLGTLQDTENERLARLLPLAVSYERRRTVRKVRGYLERYVENSLMNYGAPNDAEYAIEEFLRLVIPDKLIDKDEQEFGHGEKQLAILMLTLSEDIERAFNPKVTIAGKSFGHNSETRFDVITGFTPLIRRALRSSVAGRSHQMLQLMNSTEKADFDISASRRRLLRVVRQFEATAREMTTRIALVSTGTALKNNLFASEIPASNEPFFHDGKAVQIVRIFKPFTFLPAYGRGDDQILPPTLLDAEHKTIKPTGDVLVRIRIGSGEPIDITDRLTGLDLELLMFLNDAVANRAFYLSMVGIGEAIEEAAILTLDLAEFIPGAGQVIMVGRIVFEVGQFLLSDEFDDMLDIVRGQPAEALMELKAKLDTDLLNTDAIWQFLLFSGTAIDYLDEPRPDPQNRRNRRRRGRRGKFSRIADSIGKIPKHFYDRLNAVRKRTIPQVRNVQTFVASHQNVARGLEIASGLAVGIRPDGLNIDEIEDNISSAGDIGPAFTEKINAMLSAIDKIELPDELIPNDLVVAAMIEFILERLKRMGRLGKAVRVVLPILRATGAIDKIGEEVAEALAGTGVDPNKYWQDKIKPDIAEAFARAKAEFAATANRQLEDFGLGGGITPGEVNFEPTPLPEMTADASPLLGDRPEPSAPIGTIGPGRPLPRPSLTRAAREFGHDFSHVRLHKEGDGAGLTRRYGALGLTSGSHVFLRPGLSPDHGEGLDVMRHELAHVLQHTGPSPVGRKGSQRRTPSIGQPGKGLNVDRGREAAADRAASRAAAPGNRINQPVDAGSPGKPGLSPLGGKLFKDILDRFLVPSDIDAFVGDIMGRSEVGIATVPGMNDARRIWQQVKAALSDNRKSRFTKHAGIGNVPDLIRAHLVSGRGAEINDRVIANLAARAQRPDSRAGSGSAAGADTTKLSQKAFANVLETFLFGFTGIALSIDLEQTGQRRDVRKVTVYMVHLGRITDTTNPLWEKALAGRPETSNMSPQFREILRRLAISSRPSDSLLKLTGSSFEFHDDFVARFERLKTETAGISIAPWRDYTTVNADGPGSGDEHKLRLGTHGQLTSIGTPDRQSHHIPQFVLIQYFRNQISDRRMFNTEAERLPGFEDADEPRHFSDGTNRIDLGKLHGTSGRGDGMPAILLAAETHRRGKLHINASGSWTKEEEYGKPPRSQSGRVARRFKASASRHLRELGAPSGNNFSNIAQWANLPANQSSAKRAVFRAMQDTYHWMYRDVMRPALARALPTEEANFYAAAALQARGETATTLDQQHDPGRDIGRTNRVMNEVDKMQTSNRYEIRNFRPSI